jgi:hypothetical protein
MRFGRVLLTGVFSFEATLLMGICTSWRERAMEFQGPCPAFYVTTLLVMANKLISAIVIIVYLVYLQVFVML